MSMRTCVTRWNGKMQFTASLGSGHSLLMDASPEIGGEDQGPRPKELLLAGLGGCTGIDVVSILNKMRAAFDRFEVYTEGDEAADHPKILSEIRVVYRLWGPEESKEKAVKAVGLSWTKYCGVIHALNKSARITYRIEFNGDPLALETSEA